METLSLYQLKNEYQNLMQCIYDPEYDTQAVIDTLDGIEGEISVKADGYLKVIANIDGTVTGIDKEIERLSKMKERLSKGKDLMTDNLFKAMKETGITEINTDLHHLKIVNNGGQLPLILDELNVPKEYYKTKIIEEIDKTKIRETLKTQYLDFAKFGERGQRLKID